MFSEFLNSPYRFLLAAAVLAALFCLFPAKVDAPPQQELLAAQESPPPQAAGDLPAGADLSERTGKGCLLHSTLYYAPCGHSVQRRESLPAQLIGLSRTALEEEVTGVIPDAAVTGFSSGEVDVSRRLSIPCPLHWVLRGGEDGKLCVLQNRRGEALETVRETDVETALAPQEEQALLRQGRVFDDVQALEGYLESLSS